MTLEDAILFLNKINIITKIVVINGKTANANFIICAPTTYNNNSNYNNNFILNISVKLRI
jgi:hypothetical protein